MTAKEKANERAKQWQRDNVERSRANKRRHYLANRQKIVERSAAWAKAHPEQFKTHMRNRDKEKVRLRSERRRREHPEAMRAAVRKSQRAHPERLTAARMARIAMQKKASVGLTEIERQEILAIYRRRKILSEVTGILHHVDHILPLSRGGLHHPSNLQVIPALLNLRKGARVEYRA